MHLLINVAVGGDWPGSPDASTPSPATMTVDRVRFYGEGRVGRVSRCSSTGAGAAAQDSATWLSSRWTKVSCT
ncbi:hypothetical protein [Streptomyces sp. NPDC003877]